MAKNSKSEVENESKMSMFLGALVVVVVGILVFNYFSRINKNKTEETKEELTEEEITPKPGETKTEGEVTKYTVAEGDTLWSIAEKYYKNGYNWIDIASENKLDNPDMVHVGNVLVLPKVETISGDINGPGVSTTGPSAIKGSSYTVNKGDDLWDIAIRACGDGYKWTKLAEVNHLLNPDIIHSGNSLKITCK